VRILSLTVEDGTIVFTYLFITHEAVKIHTDKHTNLIGLHYHNLLVEIHTDFQEPQAHSASTDLDPNLFH